MSFEIDHDSWMLILETVWDAINPNGITAFILNVMTSIVLLAVLARMSTHRKSV